VPHKRSIRRRFPIGRAVFADAFTLDNSVCSPAVPADPVPSYNSPVRSWLTAVLVLLLAAPAAGQGLTLRVALPDVPALLEPGAVLEGPEMLVIRQVFDTLVRYADGSSELEPGLALSWHPSRDGLTWSFRLRDGVTFHDGTPLTAQHVAASLERLVVPGHPQAPVPGTASRLLRGTPGVVREVRAPDARTVQLALFLPYAPLPAVLAHPAFSIVLRAGATRWVGTGPFAVAEIGAGRVVLEARPGHWAGSPRVSRMVVVPVADDAQALDALDQQAIDVFLPRGRPPRLAGAVSAPSWRIGYLALQTEKEPFRQLKVRRAVAAALDPDAVGPALDAVARPLATFLPPGVWGRRETASTGGQVEEARKRAAAGGSRPAAEAALLIAADPHASDVQLAEALGAAFGAAGLGLALDRQDAARALTLAQLGEHQVTLWEAQAEAGDPHFLLYPLSASEGAVKGPSATNLSFYRNRKLDDMLIRASQVTFRPERLRLYQRVQALLADELPWLPLYVRLHWAVMRPEVRGLSLHPSGFHRLDRVWLEPPAPGR
jgi:peptide/nickel transport system substrate-binding protein